jgi:hypothetical protein
MYTGFNLRVVSRPDGVNNPDGTPAVPGSVQEYESSPEKWPDVKGVVPVGTHFEIRRMTHESGINYSVVEVKAKVVNGPFRGRTVDVDQLLISEGSPALTGQRVRRADPHWLTRPHRQ